MEHFLRGRKKREQPLKPLKESESKRGRGKMGYGDKPTRVFLQEVSSYVSWNFF
jgi:hypothetical protein